MRNERVRLVESRGALALTRKAISARLGAGRPAFVMSPRRGAPAALPALHPSTPLEVRTLRALVPALADVDPRIVASFTAAPGAAPRALVGGGDPLAFHFQALLAAWNQAYPGRCVPANYGTSETELTGARNDRTTSATKSFQRWHNDLANEPDQLPTTGAPDVPTYTALVRVGAFLAAHTVVSTPSASPAAAAKTGLTTGVFTGIGLALAAAGAYVFRTELGL